MPGDAERALGVGSLRRPLYVCDDVSSSQVKCVAVFPDGRRVVSASYDNTLKVWEVKETKIKQTFEVNVPQARYSVYAVS